MVNRFIKFLIIERLEIMKNKNSCLIIFSLAILVGFSQYLLTLLYQKYIFSFETKVLINIFVGLFIIIIGYPLIKKIIKNKKL